jgi:hypothetical protein
VEAARRGASRYPNRTKIPAKFSKTLFQRHKYAETHGWSELVRVTTKTIKDRYWGGLYKCIDWTIQEKHYDGPRPKFECIDPENLASLPRDAFDDEELLMLLKVPLFTGCKNRLHVWKPGAYFVQSHIYWGFLICILTGMRPGEVGQLNPAPQRAASQEPAANTAVSSDASFAATNLCFRALIRLFDVLPSKPRLRQFGGYSRGAGMDFGTDRVRNQTNYSFTIRSRHHLSGVHQAAR